MATPPTRVSYNTPTVGYGSTATPKTTPAFDVQAGDLLTVIGSGEDSPATLTTPTATGGSITWTLRQSIVVSQYCTMYAWTGAVGATATGITVSVTGVSSRTWSFGVTVWRNHGGVGVTSKANVASGGPSLALTTSANSAVVCGSDDWNASDGATRTWRTVNGSAMSESLYFRNSLTYTVYAGYAPDTGAAGTTTVGLSVPSAQKYSIVGIEVLGATASTTPVSTSRSTTWDVDATVTTSRSTTWTARAQASTARSTTWNVAASVAAARSTTWTVKGQVATNRSTTWNVAGSLTQVSTARATSWNVAAQASTARATTWTVRSSVISQRATTWSVLSTVAANRSTTWNVAGNLTQVSTARSTSWTVKATVAGSRSTTWTLRQSVANARATSWSVLTPAATARVTSWATLATAETARGTTWIVRELVTVDRATRWTVQTDTSGFIDVRILAVVDRSRAVTITDKSRTVTLAEHPRTVTITDRS